MCLAIAYLQGLFCLRRAGLSWVDVATLWPIREIVKRKTQESLIRNGVALHSLNKSPKCRTWGQSQKRQNDLGSFPRQTIQYHSSPSLCPNHSCWRSWSWTALWRPRDLLELTAKKKRCSFHHRGLECKSRKSRHTQNNKQVWLWSTNWSKTKAIRVLSREHTGHSKYPFSTTWVMTLHTNTTRWSIPKSDWLCYLQTKVEKLYAISKNKTWSWLWLRSLPCCKIQA